MLTAMASPDYDRLSTDRSAIECVFAECSHQAHLCWYQFFLVVGIGCCWWLWRFRAYNPKSKATAAIATLLLTLLLLPFILYLLFLMNWCCRCYKPPCHRAFLTRIRILPVFRIHSWHFFTDYGKVEWRSFYLRRATANKQPPPPLVPVLWCPS